jgi:spore germination cell wall hydrolase CwlJ-like protein
MKKIIRQDIIFAMSYIILLLLLVLIIVTKQERVQNEIITDSIVETTSENISVITPSIEEKPVENIKETEETTEKIITVYDVFTIEEIYLIQRCVETETYTADINSKMNVASVIFNRLKDGRFGDSIIEIITNKKQFAYWRTSISDETIQAIEQVWINGDTTNGALYFHSGDKKDSFNGAQYIFTDNVSHNFYK